MELSAHLFLRRIPGRIPGTVSTGALGPSRLRATDSRDLLGRVLSHSEYKPDGTTVAFSRTGITYDKRSQLLGDSTSTVQGTDTFVTNTSYNYGAGASYAGGQVVSQNAANSKIAGGVTTALPSSKTENTYVWWDGAVQSTVTNTPNINQPGTTTSSSFNYDTSGHLTSVYVNDARPRSITFTTDAQGQILTRAEADNVAGGDPKTFSFYFGGVLIGEVSNDGLGRVSYGTAINNRGVAQSGPFKAGDSGDHADFDQSYDAINPGSSGEAGAASRYAVRDGDTLQGVAAALWGDASLWYP